MNSRNVAGAIGYFGCLACCCLCCFLPGIMIIITANADYGHWDAAPAKVLNTTFCGAHRRRELETVGREHYESRIPLVEKNKGPINHKDNVVVQQIPRTVTRGTRLQGSSIKSLEDSKLFKKEDYAMDSSDDSDDEDDISEDEEDSDDETHDSQAAARKPSQATYYAFTSHKRVANRKALSRRRHLQQQFSSIPQRRTKVGGGGYAAAGAAGGYYAGSRYSQHSRTSSSDEPQYSVTYSFFTTDGQNVTATTAYCTSPAPPLGATEMVLYDPSSPSVGVVSEGYYESLHAGGWTVTIFGLIAILIIGVGFYQLVKSTRESSTTSTTYFFDNNADEETSTVIDSYSENPHDQVENPYGSPPSLLDRAC